jgi:hypothetical protein
MKKGLYTGLILSVTLASSAFAAAPVISNIPDVIIGDQDDNIGTDNNFFVFTNAFKFDDFVSDLDTAKTSLQWSFDEGDSNSTPNTRWFAINGKEAVHLGTAEIASSGNTGHNPPALANELRSVSEYASFRDIVFSPSGSGPYPDPTDPAKSDHAAGKVVTFYVSDGTNVASKSIIVATRDNQLDSLTGGAQFTQVVDDPLTSTATGNWVLSGLVPSATTTGDFDSVNGAIRARVQSDATRYRAAEWYTQSPVLPYGSVGSDKWVRAKFYVYATGQSPAQSNMIPAVRLRLMQRFMIANTLEVWTHIPGLTLDTLGADLRPNGDPANPSVYRVDYDPPEIPQNVNNPSTEGIQVSFGAYTNATQDNGYVGLAEVVLGTYPAALGTLAKEYIGSGITLSPEDSLSATSYLFTSSTGDGQAPTPDTTTVPTATAGSNGVTIDSTNAAFADLGGGSKRIGTIEAYVALGSDYTQRVRFDEGKLYQARFHVTSTRASNQQAQMRLFLRFGGYLYNLFYEVGGAWALQSSQAQALAWQQLPGVGNQNPDKEVAGENGCWYTLLLSSPLNGEIRPDVTGSVSTKMPNLSGLPGPGVNSASPRRDLKIGFGGVDSLSSTANQNLEALYYTVDKIRVYTASEPE